MADKQPENKDDGLLELIKKLWSPIIGIIGAITSLINFYQLWLGNQATIIYIFAGGGFLLLLLALTWVGFSKKEIPKRGSRKVMKSIPRYSLPFRRAAWSGLGLLTLLAIFSINALIQHRTEQESKLIVLIAAFEGPEDVYGLRNEIIENLNADFSGDENIEIISIEEIITVSKGSEYARKLGENHFADIVIWGWYRPTENPNITIHIENMSPNELLPLKESDTLQPLITISELDSFLFQQQVGDETSALISFLAGLVEYDLENYEIAITYFDISLETLPESFILFEIQSEIYFYQGNSSAYLGKYEDAIQDFDQAIKVNPQYAVAYYNRGFTYTLLEQYEHAIQDFDQTIEINPQDAGAYYNRGTVYSILDDYEHALQDYDQAIKINPQFAIAYNNRGIAYVNLGKSERAIQDYDQAIEINPLDATTYNNRAAAYIILGQYERAIQDYDQAIKIEPQNARFYNNRGATYFALGKYEQAIQDYSQVIQINPKDSDAYYDRGYVYTKISDYQSAIQDYSQAIEINPHFADAYYERGTVHFFLSEYEFSIQDFDKAIQINPDIQINPQFANNYFNQGLYYYNLDDFELAIKYFSQSIKINPQDTEAYILRGDAFQKLGKITEAEADFAKYKELTGQDAP